jgi:hypothetical protein
MGVMLGWTWTVNGVPWAPSAEAAQANANAAAAAALPPSPYVQKFLTSRASLDAAGLWDSYADEIKAAYGQQGWTPNRVAQVLQRERQSGFQLVKADHVYSSKIDHDRSVYLYMLTVRRDPQTTEQMPFTFMTLANGKIFRTSDLQLP